MSGHQWITHKGKRILSVDYSNLRGDDLIHVLRAGVEVMVAAPDKLLLLYNFENAHVDPGLMNELRKLSPKFEPQVEKAAILGVSGGPKEALLKVYKTFTGMGPTAFATEAEALEWLVKP